MAVSPEYDAVKAEKDDAMRRYTKRKTQLRLVYFFLRLLPGFLVFLCLSFPSSLPGSISGLLCSCRHYFDFSYSKTGRSQNLSAFVILNAIVFSVYFLSTSTGNSTDRRRSNGVADVSSHLHDQNVSLSSACQKEPEEEEANALCRQPTAIVDGTVKGDRRVLPRRRYRRTKSEASVVVPGIDEEGDDQKNSLRRRLMRRSETVNGRELAVVVTTPGVVAMNGKSVEEMNNDEFRMTIEKFIASKKRIFLMEENYSFPDQQ